MSNFIPAQPLGSVEKYREETANWLDSNIYMDTQQIEHHIRDESSGTAQHPADMLPLSSSTFLHYEVDLYPQHTPTPVPQDYGLSAPPPSIQTSVASPQAPPYFDESRYEQTENKRRTKNREAQRAFRERKRKHVQELEAQLEDITCNYEKLESSHAALNSAYEILRKTVDVLATGGDDPSRSESQPS